ncbi:hypothetical protein GCM10027284_39270 [Cyclobacterium sediminis]
MTEQLNKDKFDREGYLYCPSFLSNAEIDAIHSKINEIVATGLTKIPAKHYKFEDPENKKGLKMIQDLQVYDSFFEHMLLESKFSAMAEQILAEPVLGKTVEYFNKPAKIGKATPPHQDGYYFMLNPMSAVTFWLSLEKVNEENGWVSYVKGSHLNGLRAHSKSETLGFSQQIQDFGTPSDLENEVFMPTKPGDLLLHHALTIHRAAPNRSNYNSRKALGLIYFGASAKEDLDAKKAYLASLNK